jgi:hypothetical protein
MHSPTNFHMSDFNDSFIITIKPEAIYWFYVATTLSSYILQRNYFNKSLYIFWRSIHHASYQDHVLSATHAVATLQVLVSSAITRVITTLLLLLLLY